MAETQCGFNSIPGGQSGAGLLASYGPTILVDIGFDPSFPSRVGDSTPIPGVKGIRALIDTGAIDSCIDHLLASQLRLPIIDRRRVAGIGGPQLVNMYLAQVHFPSLKSTAYGDFAGVHLVAGGQWHSALVGRSFLQHYTMKYEGRTGSVTLSI